MLSDFLACFPALQTGHNEVAVNISSGMSAAGNISCNISYMDLSDLNADPDSVEFDSLKDPLNAMLVVIVYVIVIVLGTVGNTLVVVTVLKTKQLWNATNVFISNLAVADIFVCLFDLPLSLHYQITDDWIFGSALCHVIPAAFAVGVYASTLTLTLIAVDRFILIVYPLKTRMSVTVALILVVCVAVVSIVVASPIAVFSKVVVFKLDLAAFGIHTYRRYCLEEWPKSGQRSLYTVLTLVLQYFIPLVVIAILYALIFRRINLRMRHPSRRTKTTKMILAVVLVFALTWTPFHLFSLITEFNRYVVKGRSYKLMDVCLRVLAMSSSCINPLLYGWLNDNYRNAFISLFKKPTSSTTGVFKEESRVSQNNLSTSARRASGSYKETFFCRLGLGGRRRDSNRSKVATDQPGTTDLLPSLEQRCLVVGYEANPEKSPAVTPVAVGGMADDIPVGRPSVESPLLTRPRV